MINTICVYHITLEYGRLVVRGNMFFLFAIIAVFISVLALYLLLGMVYTIEK